MAIKVKLIGSLAKLAGKTEIHIKATKSMALSEATRKICMEIQAPEFEKALMDPNSKTVGPHIIVLINDRDTSVLQGLETRIKSNDEITLIPITHGG